MSELQKVRVYLLNDETGEQIEDVDVLTSAGAVSCSDGKTLQAKIDDGDFAGGGYFFRWTRFDTSTNNSVG